MLAPAGNEEMMRAAVENGADAVYFGLDEFNARLRAGNFALDDLPRLVAWLHERGVEAYVTLNTLIFTRELEEATLLLMACSDAGVDAVLVQDLGLAALAAKLVPGLTIHSSTQMTLTSAESIARAIELGVPVERVVAARELSLKELRLLRHQTDCEVEAFVHGALCVAYSGQCLTSEALGGRSANRGECAQACRLPYDLMVDGQPHDTGDLRYVLSPKDLAAYGDIGPLTEAGITCFKIEGRLKSPAYVAATVQAYRRAVDEVWERVEAGHAAPQSLEMDEATREALEMTFSRGFTGGYLHAIDHQAVVEGRYPKKRGLYLGRVVHVEAGSGVIVALEGGVKPGDGVVFDAGHPEADEEGGRVYELWRAGVRLAAYDPPQGPEAWREGARKPVRTGPAEVMLTFGRGDLQLRRVNVGDRVWKTSDPEMERRLTASWATGGIHHRCPVFASLHAQAGAPATLELMDEAGHLVRVEDAMPAEAARRKGVSYEDARRQLGRLGDTPFHLEQFEFAAAGQVMIPFSRLNDMRRRAVEELLALRRREGRDRATNPDALHIAREQVRGKVAAGSGGAVASPRLAVLCRTLEQVAAAAECDGVSAVYTDFEDVRRHREARSLLPEGGPVRFVPATLRVMKPGEAGIVRKLLEASPDAVLVRNLGAWQVLREAAPALPLLGDYSLNVANELSAGLVMTGGLEQITPSYDLNIDQLMDLLRAAPVDWFEVVIHQHLPMFHMEHCVFCRYLSDGTDWTNCGRPCEDHALALHDRRGYDHPVKADAGCRNTVFNAVAQSAAEYLPMMRETELGRFRIEFLDEDGAAVKAAVARYGAALRGETETADLWRELRAVSKLGVTRGSLDKE